MTTNRRSVPMFVTAALVLGACSSGASGSPADPGGVDETSVVQTTVVVEAQPSTLNTQATTTSVAVDNLDAVGIVVLPAAVSEALAAGVITNDGVLAAAVIIVSDGDLETAIADGIVSEAEADAAIAALESGTLHLYHE